jgi:UDP-3-O-[3-hydroxymyristoyl] glucosamine N-acyltransferase
VGQNSIIVAQTGIAGSVRIGNNVILAGQSGVDGHVEIGDGVTVAGKAGVTKNIPAGQVVSGFPAQPHDRQQRQQALVRRLPQIHEQLKNLQQQLAALAERVRELEQGASDDKVTR